MKDKITLQDIEENIVDTEIVKHITKGGKILRWAILTTKSGFAVTGRPSATINQANDNVETGEKVAIDNAKSEMWALMGYHLSVNIYEEKEIGDIRVLPEGLEPIDEHDYLYEKYREAERAYTNYCEEHQSEDESYE